MLDFYVQVAAPPGSSLNDATEGKPAQEVTRK